MKLAVATFLAIFLIDFIDYTLASAGDQSWEFERCHNECLYKNCSNIFTGNKNDANRVLSFDERQPLHLKLLGWDCSSECKYECMWKTVEWFRATKQPVPQFNGKWPFVRILGLQEPASTIASWLNLLSNYYMLKKLIRVSSPRSPFRGLWIGFGLVSINTWLWSTVFHARDTDFTEKMDYFGAFALVLYQFNAFFIRMLRQADRRRQYLSSIAINLISLTSLSYFIYHCYYLSMIHFDYGYNMKINILVGAVNGICWLSWSAYSYFVLNRKYVWRCALAIFLVAATTALEVFDFSPFLWSFDSHAIWHISTIVIPIFWFNFLIDDIYQNDLNSYSILNNGFSQKYR